MVRKILKQILSAVNFMHQRGVVHRDIKSANILMFKDGHVKLADFGLSRVTRHPMLPMTKEVQSMWYRAPEILLGSNKYTKGVDMWSLGCILAELLLGKPVFPGTSTLNQLDRVMEIIGRPSSDDIDAIDCPLA
jgi:mitogen-activated protein kinase 15